MSGAFCLCGSSGALAMGVEDAFRAAMDGDPGFQSSEAAIEVAEAGKAKAWSRLLPDARVEGRFDRVDQNIISSDNTVYALGHSRYNKASAVGRLIQPVFHWDAIKGIGKAALVEEKVRIERLDARSDLALRVVTAYLDVLFAEDDLERARREREAVRAERNRIEARHASGQASRVELEDARARGEMVEALLVQARDALQVRRANLEMLVGTHVDELERMTDEVQMLRVDPMDAKAWVERALSGNLKVRAAMLGVEIARREVAIQQAGHFPVLDAEASYDYQKTTGSVFGGGSRVGTMDLALVLKVPLISGGRVLASTREARARLRQAELRLEQARRQARRDVRDAFAGVVNGLAKLRALKRSVQAQELSLRVRERGVRAGLNTSVKVLDARRDLFIVRRDYARARYEYVKHYLRLKRAAGELEDKDLKAVDGLLRGDES